jgi:hypothetical protein
MNAMSEQGTNGITKDSIGLVESLADRLGAKARASTLYGEPVDREGVTVIPVARAMWGFGGGTRRDDEREVGAGGGGGMVVSPVGYIEIKDGSSTYRPIFKPPMLAMAAAVGMAIGLALARVATARCRS